MAAAVVRTLVGVPALLRRLLLVVRVEVCSQRRALTVVVAVAEVPVRAPAGRVETAVAMWRRQGAPAVRVRVAVGAERTAKRTLLARPAAQVAAVRWRSFHCSPVRSTTWQSYARKAVPR